ncbi:MULTISPECIES: hypothetical protein [Bacillaceae]|nr:MULTISPECIES: hypothetical protein [Bacillaceae]
MKEVLQELKKNEAIRGLLIGLCLMIIAFLFIHYGLGIKAFE